MRSTSSRRRRRRRGLSQWATVTVEMTAVGAATRATEAAEARPEEAAAAAPKTASSQAATREFLKSSKSLNRSSSTLVSRSPRGVFNQCRHAASGSRLTHWLCDSEVHCRYLDTLRSLLSSTQCFLVISGYFWFLMESILLCHNFILYYHGVYIITYI